jgi:hypothetical protein
MNRKMPTILATQNPNLARDTGILQVHSVFTHLLDDANSCILTLIYREKCCENVLLQ